MRVMGLLLELRVMTPDYTAAILRLGTIGAVALGGALCANAVAGFWGLRCTRFVGAAQILVGDVEHDGRKVIVQPLAEPIP